MTVMAIVLSQRVFLILVGVLEEKDGLWFAFW